MNSAETQDTTTETIKNEQQLKVLADELAEKKGVHIIGLPETISVESRVATGALLDFGGGIWYIAIEAKDSDYMEWHASEKDDPESDAFSGVGKLRRCHEIIACRISEPEKNRILREQEKAEAEDRREVAAYRNALDYCVDGYQLVNSIDNLGFGKIDWEFKSGNKHVAISWAIISIHSIPFFVHRIFRNKYNTTQYSIPTEKHIRKKCEEYINYDIVYKKIPESYIAGNNFEIISENEKELDWKRIAYKDNSHNTHDDDYEICEAFLPDGTPLYRITHNPYNYLKRMWLYRIPKNLYMKK